MRSRHQSNRRPAWIVLASCAACVALGISASPSATHPPARTRRTPAPARAGQPVDPELYAQGRFVYERHCIACHGKWGDGKGEMAQGMRPRPRKFSAAVFKFRSTPSGFLPVDEDLARTVRRGISLSAMPAFGNLSDRDLRAVVEYVKSFSLRWSKPENHAPALPLPQPPPWLKEDALLRTRAAAGQRLYEASCIQCHGPGGDSTRATAGPMLDAWEEPCPPIDLRLPYIRSGSDLSDIYRALVTGLDGTPMPSFRETTTEEQRWELIAYIETLRRDAAEAARARQPQAPPEAGVQRSPTPP